MTMQNHTPWNEPNPIDMNASYPGFSDNANKQLSAYIRMLYHTDNATQDFLERLSKIDKKITVVSMGIICLVCIQNLPLRTIQKGNTKQTTLFGVISML